ncbi:Dipeptide-binding protein [Roseomonas mucosa]|uniref:ABC transporter substrate-binding protein n=1 Tax=Roseomonas TaxID=125216 RepID=UPI00095A426F|nr:MULTISPECIES: ABC transporter substrate-binding protein [Roseomonas]ATR22267.1 ABC transporter substrate-binding protein [Roseomonas sp. FDAARGOS_362]MDT8278047.1 ABC transporter substrate-binding protein [Roseomonas mucosa]MDT8355483.1 ABC transporter substrate-binding protein [Roseomonas mucosa]USQ73056.1 ABC transporter substrate-binding protein [Roseomonas mucosa]UZO95209.1 Dipeptide-binding protein [Roseomonas mucosa]
MIKTVSRRAALLASLFLPLCGTLAAAPAQAEPLSLAVSAPPASIDPHYYTLTPSIMLSSHIFSRLVQRDEKSRVVPDLAESWKLVDDTTWEFKLRPGVKFHNGADFTAEDVAYSLERVPMVQSPSSFSVYTRDIADVQVVDPLTVRLKTNGPSPLLPANLANIFIVSRSVAANSSTADFNSGKAAIGTGPYKFVSYDPNNRVKLARDDGYYGEKPAWETVDYRIISNDGARVAALLSGDVALIDAVPTADAARLRKDDRLTVAEANSTRLIFLGLDEERQEGSPDIAGPDGGKLEKNPLRDHRVREALSIAINRPAIVSRVMEGAALPSGQFMPPGVFGYDPSIPVPAFAPDRAKELLAQAGYPNGLSIILRGPNDRYVNDAQIQQTVAQMWTRIGVRTRVEAQPLATVIGRLNRFEASAYLLGWSNSTGEPSSSLKAVLGTRDPALGRGLSNYGRYSNPEFDKLVQQALGTLDDKAREGLMQKAMKMAMEDVAIIPLHLQKSVWAMRKGYAYTPRADEETRAMGLRPAK